MNVSILREEETEAQKVKPFTRALEPWLFPFLEAVPPRGRVRTHPSLTSAACLSPPGTATWCWRT